MSELIGQSKLIHCIFISATTRKTLSLSITDGDCTASTLPFRTRGQRFFSHWPNYIQRSTLSTSIRFSRWSKIFSGILVRDTPLSTSNVSFKFEVQTRSQLLRYSKLKFMWTYASRSMTKNSINIWNGSRWLIYSGEVISLRNVRQGRKRKSESLPSSSAPITNTS